MIQILWSIARNAFMEVVRQPIYAILLVAGLCMIGLSPVITGFTMMEEIKLAVDMGLGTIFMVGILLSVLGTTQVISEEIDSKTAGAVISKPVGRVVFIAGKFFGVAAALVVAAYLLILMLIMTVRMGVPTTAAFTLDVPVLLAQTLPLLLAVIFGAYCNYFHRGNFSAAAIRAGFLLYTIAFIMLLFIGKEWQFEWLAHSFAEVDAWPITLAAVSVFFGVTAIASVALAASTRVNVVANIMICLTVFFIGMVSNYMFGRTVDTGWVYWEPVEMLETVEIAGAVTDENTGEPVEGVKIIGAPGQPVTDANGRYRATVRRGGSGELSPRKTGIRFTPDSRSYSNVDEDRSDQNFSAREVRRTPAFYARFAWRGVSRLAYHTVPALEVFWVGDQLMRPYPYIPVSYVARAMLYGLLWCAGMVALAAYLFEGRELA